MDKLPESITALSHKHGFVKSAKYDQGWMFDNSMGPNPLWLVEWLTRGMQITKDTLVLDMGCGKALTSIFLAREFGCTVFANDLWIPADQNLKRIKEATLEKQVFPIHAEAHDLPYAKAQFDAIVSIDAYHYFGTDDSYLAYFCQFLKPGGQIGIVIPGWLKDIGPMKEKWPRYLDVKEYIGFHTCEWWKNHFSFGDLLDIDKSEYLANARVVWLDSAIAMLETKNILRGMEGMPAEEKKKELDFWKGDIDPLRADIEGYLSIIRIIGKRK